MSDLRLDLQVRLDGFQGTLSVAAEAREDTPVVWLTCEGYGDDEGVSVGVDPADLRSAIMFVLGEPLL